MDREGTRRRSGCLVAALASAALLILFVLLWGARRPIARHYVDRALAARGVPARYEIRRLGVLEQRIDHLVIGDPHAPDLVAESAVLRLGWSLDGPVLRAVRARGVRLHGRLVGGRVSLGAIDRLLPPPGKAPFALPDLKVDLEDARMRLDTPAGQMALSLRGKGNLADGFSGQIGAVASGLAGGGCRVTGASAFLDVSIRDRRATLKGPVRAGALDCGARGAVRGIWLAPEVTLGPALDRWSGAAGIAIGGVATGDSRVEGVRGRIDFAGDAGATQGALALVAGPAHGAAAGAARLAVDGRYAVQGAGATLGFDGRLRATDARVDGALLRPLLLPLRRADGTPLGPLAQALGGALARASTRFAADAGVAIQHGPSGGRLRIARLAATSASGARITLDGGDGAGIGWGSAPATRTDGTLRIMGGGLPTVRLTLRQSAPGAPISGEGEMAPYAAGGARLGVTALRFAPTPRGGTGFAAVPIIDGPLADGRVTGLTLPLAGEIARGGFTLNRTCAPLSFASLSLAGTRIGASRLTLCPTGGALLAKAPGGALAGGGTFPHPRLLGGVGAQRLVLEAAALRFAVAHPGFAADALAVRLGTGEAVTRLDIPRLDGAAGASGLAGRFAGASGRIANVPLLLSDLDGTWRLANGALALTGRLAVADAAAAPRFNRLVTPDVRLDLKGGTVTASGTLREPNSGRAVATVDLRHSLRDARGQAVLGVSGIAFDPHLQPEALTRLALGVVANVAGTVRGRGIVRWSPQGVSSDGAFRTDDLALAAAFGPVTGLKGEIRFSDLLGLKTPPGQEVTLATVNPGIEVTDGVVRYQLLGDEKVRVESGRWPFAGGALTLEPTTLDFATPTAERRFVFRVNGLDAAQFIERFKLSNIAATGSFDGVLPIVFDAKGGRIEEGRLVVRQGGGTLSYVGDVSNAQLGTFGKLAFDALKAIRYDALEIDLGGALDGELVSRILFTGVNESPATADKKKGMLGKLTGLPFKFTIVVRAPFRGLLNSAGTFVDPSGVLRNPTGAVQTQESGRVP